MTIPKRDGPPLAKVRRVRLVRRRTLSLVALLDAPMAALLASADVMAEGVVREEAGVPRFYGTTDLLVRIEDDEPERVARVVAVDPHVRVRALRIARQEACLRAGAPLSTMRAEMTVEPRDRAVRIHVELEAEVLSSRLARTP